MDKAKIYYNQLDKYCRLENNERIFVIDEKIMNTDYTSIKTRFHNIQNKNKKSRAFLMSWERKIRNHHRLLGRDITKEETYSLYEAIKAYQSILGCIGAGWFLEAVRIKKIDILEALISNSESLYEEIDHKKRGYIKEKIGTYNLAQEHVVTVIECEEYLTIKEIYIPYSGIVIQLPTE